MPNVYGFRPLAYECSLLFSVLHSSKCSVFGFALKKTAIWKGHVVLCNIVRDINCFMTFIDQTIGQVIEKNNKHINQWWK